LPVSSFHELRKWHSSPSIVLTPVLNSGYYCSIWYNLRIDFASSFLFLDLSVFQINKVHPLFLSPDLLHHSSEELYQHTLDYSAQTYPWCCHLCCSAFALSVLAFIPVGWSWCSILHLRNLWGCPFYRWICCGCIDRNLFSAVYRNKPWYYQKDAKLFIILKGAWDFEPKSMSRYRLTHQLR
jgi:hypothetical protein